MEIKTKYHGIRHYEQSDIINFKKGLPGFENLHKFILFEADENEIFSVLHSVENEEIGLVVLSPFMFKDDYEFKIPEDSVKELEVNSQEDLAVFCTVTLSSDIKKVTSNIKAPIIINIKDKKGEQIILQDESLDIKYPLFKEWFKCL